MRRLKTPIPVLLCLVLIWQGLAGALASGRMASFDARVAGVLCRPGGGDAQGADPQAVAEHALCALHCGAVHAASAPEAPRLAIALAQSPARYDAARAADAPQRRFALPPPARGPPTYA